MLRVLLEALLGTPVRTEVGIGGKNEIAYMRERECVRESSERRERASEREREREREREQREQREQIELSLSHTHTHTHRERERERERGADHSSAPGRSSRITERGQR